MYRISSQSNAPDSRESHTFLSLRNRTIPQTSNHPPPIRVESLWINFFTFFPTKIMAKRVNISSFLVVAMSLIKIICDFFFFFKLNFDQKSDEETVHVEKSY